MVKWWRSWMAAFFLCMLLACVAGLPAESAEQGLSDADVTLSAAPTLVDKNNLTDAEKKLSTDLLVRVREMTPESGAEVVDVYVTLRPGAPTSVVDRYAIEVTARDEEHHLAVARVRLDRLMDLAGQDEVLGIRAVFLPVTREPTPEPTRAPLGWAPLLFVAAVPFLRRR
jgi:hypothetical protein